MMRNKLFLSSFIALGLIACSPANKSETTKESAHSESGASETASIKPSMKVFSDIDKFTYSNYNQVRMTHLDLDLDVDFDRKVLTGMAAIDFQRIEPGAKELVLDSKGLDIQKVELRKAGKWSDTAFALSDKDEMMGEKLTILLLGGADQVRIKYETSPDAEGLQWLDPAQTAGKNAPYLFSQAQAINARTMAPVQDTPAVRITYKARLRTPKNLIALMSADQDPKTPRDGDYEFSMPQPIPAYLLAIAVGDIDFKAINDHIGVYAEDYILDASAKEFSETPQMEDANVALYGPYRWGRYDMLVLPPSFPFGGMENPRLSFLTPTLVAGDKSLTNVVAHELAHSWSGNLVTNATWRDSWLNEGFTSYVENRVMEALYGEKRAVMEQVLAYDDLARDIKEARPELTQLKLPADLAHPDEAFTNVAYVKGQFFLAFLEQRFGRDKFDAFLKSYFNHFAFQSVTTEDFISYLHEHLHKAQPDALTRAELDAWVSGPGLPGTFTAPKSDVFDKVAAQSKSWLSGDVKAADLKTTDWTTHEWLYFLGGLPDNLTIEQMRALDSAFGLTNSQNAEIAFAWYMQAIKHSYEPARDALENFLMTVGRGKFIYRLYGALKDNGDLDWAKDVYSRARPGYHPIAQRRIDKILVK